MANLPVLWTFRRCPYAMRARLALTISKISFEWREIILRHKPAAMLEASPKGTVPVLVLPDGTVLEESLDIMHWALARHDPESWLGLSEQESHEIKSLILQSDNEFKHHLDRTKYHNRYEGADPEFHRTEALKILHQWDQRLSDAGQFFGSRPGLADMAIFPFVRQFANIDRSWFSAQSLPALHQWLQGHLESELFAGIMEKHPPWQDGDAPLLFPPQNPARQTCSEFPV
jgi:glutathione S-transferase